jgi:hypothetical protein
MVDFVSILTSEVNRDIGIKYKLSLCNTVLLGRPRRRWEDNIKMDLQELRCGGKDWIELVQDRALVNVIASEIELGK